MRRAKLHLTAYALVASSILLFGCAGAPHWDRGDVNLEPYQPVPPPSHGKAQIVFYRPAVGDPSLYAFPILDDQVMIGAYFKGTYFYYETDPGEHAFWMNWGGSKQYFTTHLESNKTQYVQVMVQFTVVGESLALPEIRKLQHITTKRETLKQSMTGEHPKL
jgi:hypothetical protein